MDVENQGDSYAEGKAAYLHGLQFLENPYDPVTCPIDYQKWDNGYWMASVQDASES